MCSCTYGVRGFTSFVILYMHTVHMTGCTLSHYTYSNSRSKLGYRGVDLIWKYMYIQSSHVERSYMIFRSTAGEQNHREVDARRSEATNTHIRPGKIDSGETFTVTRSYFQDEVKSRRHRETRKKWGETHVSASKKKVIYWWIHLINVASWRELYMYVGRRPWQMEDKSESTVCTKNWSDNIYRTSCCSDIGFKPPGGPEGAYLCILCFLLNVIYNNYYYSGQLYVWKHVS